MNETLILKPADIQSIACIVAEIVSNRIEPILQTRQRRLVDRPTMAQLANLGTATLDRLVAAKRIPSVLVGKRRLFDPDRVIDALANDKGADDETM